MGIPRLFTHLQPYGVSEEIAIQHVDGGESFGRAAQATTRFIIDGPSLAYHIFNRLLAHKPSVLNVLDALPSHKELGEGFLAYLDELQSHGTDVDFIFFDGFLPLGKRTTRHDRQDQLVKDLSLFYATHIHGFEPTHPSDPADLSYKHQLFTSNRKPSLEFRGLPPPAFLIPTILDTLQGSQYATRTRLVPEEADVSCARTAQSSGGIILTHDSDLLVYDLGLHGAVAFLSKVQLTGGESIGGRTVVPEILRMSVWRPIYIAKKLDLPNLSRFAFEIRQDRRVTLTEAVHRAKKPKDTTEFQDFMREYEVNSITAELTTYNSVNPRMVGVPHQQFDPRVAELFFQILSSNEIHSAPMYLPFLLEDPSRSTAWAPSSHIRALAYTILCSHLSGKRHARKYSEIMEYVRKGSRFAPEQINVAVPYEEVEKQAYELALRFQKSQTCDKEDPPTPSQSLDEESTLPSNHLSYHLFALSEIHTWHLNANKSAPSPTSMTRILSTPRTTRWTWEDVHLAAQVQGVLYSLRILKQILQYVNDSTETSLSPGVESMHKICEALPTLERLDEALAGKEADGGVLQRAVERLTKRLHPEMDLAGFSTVLDSGSTSTGRRKAAKEKRRKKQEKPQTVTKTKALGSRNMYDMLAEGDEG